MALNSASAIISEPIDPVSLIRTSYFGSIVALIFLGATLHTRPAMAIEEPDYTVISTDGQVEIREYGATLAAEVMVDGDRDEAVNAGFRILAGYIFGANHGRAKIAMTAPVTQSQGESIAMTAPVTQSAEGQKWRIRFMMPKAYTKDTLPIPNDTRIAIVDIPARRVAVMQFSSMWTDAALNARKDELLAAIKAKNLKPIGSPTFAFYDPPWKPFFWRRNEVMLEIRK